MSDNIAIYPGSFDPITNGHLDLIERGRHLFDHLVVALLTNLEKQPLFSVDERLEMLRLVTKGMPNVSLDTFSGLLVDYVETVFLMPAESYSYVSSRLVKEVFQHGGSVKDLVPPIVEERLRQKVFRKDSRAGV